MLSRLTRIVGSLAAVISTYVVYSFTVASIVVPPPIEGQEEPWTDLLPGDPQAGEKARLARFFAPDDWERTSNPIVLETKQSMMLLGSYKQLNKRQVELKPFSMVFLATDKSGNEIERDRRAIVLRAHEGAVLQFDGPVEFKPGGEIGKLIGGQLRGKIVIHSQQRSPGPEDDLRIVASEVKLTENQIWTLKPVKFELGPNHGSGRHLRIDLVKDLDDRGKQRGPNIGGIRSFELAHDVSMWLEPDTVDLGMGQKKPPQPVALAAGPKEPEPPVEVTCSGPFRFDVEKYVATFEEEVNVVRMHPRGPSDSLSCEVLSLFFEPRDGQTGTTGDKRNKRSVPKLAPSRIEARGSPVVIRAPSEKIEARCQFLRYDVKTRGGTLWVSDQSVQDAWIRREGEEIHGRQLYFESDGTEDNNVKFAAHGPGSLTGSSPDDPAQQISASWTGGAKFRPLDGLLVVSLEGAVEDNRRGRVRVDLPGQGYVEAEEIHIWLQEPPPKKATDEKDPPPRPDRLLAQGNVVIDSPQLTGRVDAAEVWFDNPPITHQVPRQTLQTAQPAGVQAQASPFVSSNSGVAAHQPAASAIEQASPGLRAGLAPKADEQKQRFDISGRRLRLRVSLLGKDPEVTEAMVEGGVRLVQTQLSKPEDKPLLVTGDHVHLLQPTPDTGTVTVTGTDSQPAHVEARGLTLDGREIVLDRTNNWLRIDSPGMMTYPIDKDLEGNPLDRVRPLTITWQERMEFDGAKAVFYRNVEAREERQLLRTGRLEVNLMKKIVFQESDEQEQPDLESIVCGGQVYLERYTYELGKLDSVQKMQAYNMTMNQRTGVVNASGPGWLKVVRIDTGDPFQTLPSGPTTTAKLRPAVARADDEKKSFLGVEFDDRLVGNTAKNRRQTTFYGHVRSTYGEVESWDSELDADELESLGERGATMSCRELTVAEGARNAEGKSQVELIAGGNIRVEGTKFTALANRMTYDQAKDLLILEGDGRAPAELYHRKHIGAPENRNFARKISYWRRSGHVIEEDARQVNVNFSQLPNLNSQPAAGGANRR